jgi:tape measure domain-containing protein
LSGENRVSIKDRLIQFVLRGKDELSPEAKKSAEALAAVSAEAEALGKALDSAKDARGLAKGLESTQRAAERAESSLVQADLQIKELRDALNKAPGSEGLQQSLKDAEREARRMQRGLDALHASLADQEKAARAAGIDTNHLADEEKRLAAEVDKAKSALAENSQQLKELQRAQAAAARSAAEHSSQIDTVTTGATDAAVRFGKWLVGIYLVDKALQGLGAGVSYLQDGISSMLQTGDSFELLDKRMISLMGSVADGEQATAWIKDFAKSTPLELADVTEAFALLKSYGLDPMDGSLQAIVDKNEQLGGGMERLQGISSALGQAFAKQKLQTEEILQLVERGVPVWGLLEKVTGKNTVQLQKLATEGRLGKDVIKALIDEMGKGAAGAAAENMGTLTGLVSNLKDTWSDFLNRISKSGAMDAVKNKLKGVSETIEQMDKDGRLDKLAKALSDAFVQGAEKVEQFARRLVGVDFNKLADDSSAWLSGFGEKIDAAATKVQLFVAPFSTLFNGLRSGLSIVAGSLLVPVQAVAQAVSLLAKAVPEALGGDAFRASVQEANNLLSGLSNTLANQIMESGENITEAWDTTSSSMTASTEAAVGRQTDIVKDAAAERRAVDQAITDEEIANRHRAKQAMVDAAVTGKAAITDMANAMQLINSAESVRQVEGLRAALLAAYRDGKLSQEEYSNATNVLNGKLKDLSGAASNAADGVSDLEEKLGDLKSIQAAISNAKTDIDISKIKAALGKLYGEGAITAAQYNTELKKASDQQKELKKAVTDGKKAQDAKNDSDKEAIVTSEQLRRESGKRMDEERKAMGQAMEDRRKGAAEAKQDMGAMEDFFGGVLTRAREPLAAMSAAALEAFDKLSGISTVDMSLDTGSLDETTASLEKATEALGQMQSAANTVGMSGLGIWMTTTAVRSQELQVQFLQQKAALQSLMEGYEKGSMTTQEFINGANSVRSSLGLLNDSDLRTLEGAIEAARQKMQQLQEGSKATLTSLSEELMGLRGETEALERSKFAGRRADLQQQIVDAQKSGDTTSLANLNKALSALRQIESETGQKRQLDEQQKRLAAAKPAEAAQPSGPAKIIRLETSKGKAVDVAVNSARDETNLLSILEDAGLRAL